MENTYIWHQIGLWVLTTKRSVQVSNLPFVSSEHTVLDDIKGVVYTTDIIEEWLGPI